VSALLGHENASATPPQRTLRSQQAFSVFTAPVLDRIVAGS